MAYQQRQVLCPANAWTQLCELLPTRKSLLVQCPQVALTVTVTNHPILAGVSGTLLPANPLRRSVAFSCGINADLWVTARSTGIGIPTGQFWVGYGAADVQNIPLIIGPDNFAQLAAAQWSALAGSQNTSVDTSEEIYQCRAIILATSQNPSVAGGPYGNAPPGNWLSSDLSAGPSNFRLQEALDGEQTSQSWYAWPVGSVPVNVTVSEAWDVVIPDPPPSFITVKLPTVGAEARKHLLELQRKILAAQKQPAKGEE